MEKRGRTIREKNPREGHHQKFYKKKKRDTYTKKRGGGAAESKTSRRCPLPLIFFLTSIPPSLSIKS
jgi:hypothetical protein